MVDGVGAEDIDQLVFGIVEPGSGLSPVRQLSVQQIGR